jgi:hypothetical protein
VTDIGLAGTETSEPSDSPTLPSAELVPWWKDVLGVGWVVGAVLLVMVPALRHGISLGPYGLLSRSGLLSGPLVKVRNPFGADQVAQIIPWSQLAWIQVHSGQLPLWNPYNALGVPLAFNWQSATFSLPALLSYMAPLRAEYTIQVLVTLVVAGTGIYVFARVLRLNVVACAFAGTVFGLSGSFIGWLGWPVDSVMSWSGWLLAAAVLILRGGRRATSVTLFSVALAFAVFAGEPDTLALVAGALVVFVIVMVAMGLPDRHGPSGLRPLGDLFLAVVAGLALSAPLLLPGLQLLAGSGRNARGGVFPGQQALSTSHLLSIMIPGLNGFPISWNRSYIGLVAVALAAAGWIRYRRRPEVSAMGAVGVVAAIVCFAPPVESLLNGLPGLGAVRWARSVNVVELAVAVLAGVGVDVLIRFYRERAVLRLFEAIFAAAGLAVFAIWMVYPRGDAIRVHNLRWAGAGAALGLAVFAVLEWVRLRSVRREGRTSSLALALSGANPTAADGTIPMAAGRPGGPKLLGNGLRSPGLWAALLLVACQSAFLVVMGSSEWSSNSSSFTTTPAVVELQRAVGSGLVALGSSACKPDSLGIPVNANIVYGVRELAAYDPMLPRRYYQAWHATTGVYGGNPATSRYCPVVTSVKLARLYGVAFVLESHGVPGPKGAVFDATIGNEDLYRIPGAAQATLVRSPVGHSPAVDAKGTAVVVTQAKARSWSLVTDSNRPEELRLRLTDVPGWHATIDGRALPLDLYAGVMMQAKIPPGRHVIVLTYWPTAFTVGIVLAVISGLVLAGVPVLGLLARRRASSRR